MTEKITLKRFKNQEDRNVSLFYADKKGDVLVSVVGESGDIRGRISTPKETAEIGFVGAKKENIVKRESDFQRAFKRRLKLMGFNATFKKKSMRSKPSSFKGSDISGRARRVR